MNVVGWLERERERAEIGTGFRVCARPPAEAVRATGTHAQLPVVLRLQGAGPAR